MATDLPGIAKALRTLDRSDIRSWLRRGELLTQARTLCTVDREFAAWLRSTGTARASAYKAMSAFVHFGSVSTSGRFTREAMDLLAANADARSAAITLSTTTKITGKTARRLLREHLPLQTLQPLSDHIAGKTDACRRVIIGEGFKVSLTFERPPTVADIFGAIAHASRVLRDEMGRAA